MFFTTVCFDFFLVTVRVFVCLLLFFFSLPFFLLFSRVFCLFRLVVVVGIATSHLLFIVS